MQKIFSIVVLTSAVFLASCGGSEGTGAATEQKAKLTELKKQKEGIEAEIKNWKPLLPSSIRLPLSQKMPSW